MADQEPAAADDTAVRVALWRAMHVEVDPPPHVLEDEIGLKLAAPADGWRSRPDMDPRGHGRSAPPSWPAPASSRTWSRSRPAAASASTSSSARAWTPSPSAGRRSPPACGVRGRPARSSGVEAAAPRRARLRRPRLAAARAGRLRGGRVVAGAAGGRGLRRGPAGGRGLHRGQHVPHQGGERGHAAPGRGARPGLHAGDDVQLPLELVDPEDRPGSGMCGAGARGQRDAVHQLLHAGGDAGAGPRRRISRCPARVGRDAGPALLRGPDGWPASADRAKSSWWRPPDQAKPSFTRAGRGKRPRRDCRACRPGGGISPPRSRWPRRLPRRG